MQTTSDRMDDERFWTLVAHAQGNAFRLKRLLLLLSREDLLAFDVRLDDALHPLDRRDIHEDHGAENEAARMALGDFGQMTTFERNVVWRMFASPTLRRLVVDWEGHARQLVAQFRVSCGRYPGDPQLTELIRDLLLRSPEFRAWWSAHEVLGVPEGRKAFNHPQAG